MSSRPRKLLLSVALSVLALQPRLLWACAACYGQSDSPLAKGMNWGIFSLLGVIAGVLAGIASFFVYLGVKSSGDRPEASGPAAVELPKKD